MRVRQALTFAACSPQSCRARKGKRNRARPLRSARGDLSCAAHAGRFRRSRSTAGRANYSSHLRNLSSTLTLVLSIQPLSSFRLRVGDRSRSATIFPGDQCRIAFVVSGSIVPWTFQPLPLSCCRTCAARATLRCARTRTSLRAAGDVRAIPDR